MVDLKFDKIRKIEGIKDGKLVWNYATASYLNGKTFSMVSGDTGQDVQNQIEYALKNPDEYIAKCMREGKGNL
jgi:hypothetical protein